MNTEDLIKTKPREEFLAAIPAVNDVQMATAELLQAQRHAGHRTHKGGIHHCAICQIDYKFAITAVQHRASKLLQVPAVQEISFTLYFHPYGWTVYPYLNR